MSLSPETNSLMVQGEVSGLQVHSRDGDSLGHVKAFMIDKGTGQATYAVLILGGFLGMSKSCYPVPFSLLAYDPAADRYVVTIDRRMLEGGPSWSNKAPEFNRAYAERVSSYYVTLPTVYTGRTGVRFSMRTFCEGASL
jgi:hypothetical protein